MTRYDIYTLPYEICLFFIVRLSFTGVKEMRASKSFAELFYIMFTFKVLS